MHSHRVLAELELFSPNKGGLDFEVQEKNRSLLFVFSPLEKEPLQHGAVIEQLFDKARPGTRAAAKVQFFDDSAAIVASAGAEFDLWLGRTVGRGVVKKSSPSGEQVNAMVDPGSASPVRGGVPAAVDVRR